MAAILHETDLYLPIKRFLESQGYEVKAEVGDCDVFAIRGTEAPVVVELKLGLSLDLVLQAVDRQSLTQNVYIGLPRPRLGSRRRRQVGRLLRMLGVGLLVVDPAGPGRVEVLIDPGPYRPRASAPRRQRLLAEFARRVGDPNLGGMRKRGGIVTAYRQRAVAIARFLEEQGRPTRASAVAVALGDPKARDILYRDVYGWFDRVARGSYALSPRGIRELAVTASAGRGPGAA